MRNSTITFFILIAFAVLFLNCDKKLAKKGKQEEKVVLAYVTSWTNIMPDPSFLTHINYAFGHVNDTFDGVKIDNEDRLKAITDLKKQYPHLKVFLSIGGWGSGRFSEMAADNNCRKSFAVDCKRVVNVFNLDGIDIDWEYPTSGEAGISSSPADTENFTLMMKDVREEIGGDKLLTLATAANGKYIDFRAIDPYIDFINIMTYDMGGAPFHHSGLYKSKYTKLSADEAVKAHVDNGVPIEKLVLGIPFYGKGNERVGGFTDYKNIIALTDFEERWDEESQIPYLVDESGEHVCGFDNPKSIGIKCQYIKDKGMLGAMYWEYDGDDAQGTLRKAVYNGLTK